MGKHGYMDGFDEKREDDYDFGIDPVIGVRGFRMDDDGYFTGWSFKKRWMNGENVAVCGVERFTEDCQRVHKHKSTGTDPKPECYADPADGHDLANCSHGFWGYFTDVEHEGIKDETYMAIVSAYGKTLIGEKGFRAEKAQIVAVAMPDSIESVRKTRVKELKTKRTHLYQGIPFLGIPAAGLGWLVGALTTSAVAVPAFLVLFGIMSGLLHWYIQTHETEYKSVELYWEEQPPVQDPNVVRTMSLYPDVKIYSSVESMLEDFPLAVSGPYAQYDEQRRETRND